MQSLARVFQSFVWGAAPRSPQANDQNASITVPPNNNNVPLNNEGRPPQVNARQHSRSFLSMVLCHRKNNHTNTHNTHNTPVISHSVTAETDQTAQTAKQLSPGKCYKAIQKLGSDEERRAFVAAQPQWLSALGLQMKQTTDSTSGASTSTAPVTPQVLSIKAATQLAYVLPYLPNFEQKQQALDTLQRSIADIVTKKVSNDKKRLWNDKKASNNKPHADCDKLATQLARSAHAIPIERELPLQKHIVRLVRSMRKVIHNDVYNHVYELPRLKKTYEWAKQDLLHKEIDLRRICGVWSEDGSPQGKKLYLESEIFDLPEDFHEVVQQVEKLNFRHPRFKEIPAQVFELSNLKELTLSKNLSINQLESLSGDISKLQQLEKLHLRNHQITSLPDSIGELKFMRDLNVSKGQLKSLPTTLAKLENLVHLDFSQNKIHTIPEGIFSLDSLIDINAFYNQLTALPADFKEFPKDGKFNFACNPFEAGYVDQQRYLALRGPLSPDEFCKALSEVREEDRFDFVYDERQSLSAWGVQMTQTTDSTSGASTSTAPVTPQVLSIKAATQLAYVLPYLSNIEQQQQALDTLQRSIADILTKKVPNDKSHPDCDKLATQLARSAHAMPHERELPLQKHIVRLVCSMAEVTHDEVYNHVYELPRLRKAYEWAKQDWYHREFDLIRMCSVWSEDGSVWGKELDLKSEIFDLPADFHEVVQQAEKLIFRHPRFKEIPAQVFELSNLKELTLSNNQLESLSGDISKLQKLKKLHLRNHRMTSLPDSLGELKFMRDLDVSEGQLESLPTTLAKLKSLAYLNFRENKIHTIPEGIFSLMFLHNINAAYNQLKALPADFKEFRQDGIAYLAHNPFPTGYIDQQKEIVGDRPGIYGAIYWGSGVERHTGSSN